METITKSEYAVVLTTTLNLLREHHACAPRYERLLRCLGGPSFDHDAPINLLTILEHNGLDDTLWALRATAQNCDRIARLLACDYAESVLPIYERRYPGDSRPRNCIEVAQRFSLGMATTEELAAAGDAAGDAAWDAAGDAAWNARAAAGDAAREKQKEIFVGYLQPESANA